MSKISSFDLEEMLDNTFMDKPVGHVYQYFLLDSENGEAVESKDDYVLVIKIQESKFSFYFENKSVYSEVKVGDSSDAASYIAWKSSLAGIDQVEYDTIFK